MITKRNLMIAGGLIAAYYVWKKYIKEDETVVTPTGDEGMSNAIGFKTCHCGGTQGDEYLCGSNCKDCCTKRRRKDINKGRV